MSDAWAIALAKVVDLIILLIQDMPPEERRASWKRWFRFWKPFWKALGLEDEDPLGPSKDQPAAAAATGAK